MDYLQPDEIITVGTEINEVTLDSSKAGHVLNEKLTVENALRGLLMPSGNDSANVQQPEKRKMIRICPLQNAKRYLLI